jgi:hypothetical protein
MLKSILVRQALHKFFLLSAMKLPLYIIHGAAASYHAWIGFDSSCSWTRMGLLNVRTNCCLTVVNINSVFFYLLPLDKVSILWIFYSFSQGLAYTRVSRGEIASVVS